MLDYELEKLVYIDKVDFMNKECKMISVYIFRRIFKSQKTNMDTVCCIIGHMINLLMTRFSVPNVTLPDGSLDVTEVTGAGGAEGEDGKAGAAG